MDIRLAALRQIEKPLPGRPAGDSTCIYLHAAAFARVALPVVGQRGRCVDRSARSPSARPTTATWARILSALKHHGWSSPATLAGAVVRTASTPDFWSARAGWRRVRQQVCCSHDTRSRTGTSASPFRPGIDAHSRDAPYQAFRIGGGSAGRAQGGCGGAARAAMARKARARARPTEKRRYRNCGAVTPICATKL